MPHVARFLLNGTVIPSVNTVTDSLSKDGLIRNFYRKLGFKMADKVGGAARDKGIAMAAAFEDYRKFGTKPRKAYEKVCVKNWQAWFDDQDLEVMPDFVEAHLVNTREGYHGSPDIVMAHPDGDGILGDDKVKKRFSDYKILMNEHAYAMCDSYEDDQGMLHPVPWDIPIKTFWLWTYHPQTGKLFPIGHQFNQGVYQDFLICKEMFIVNKTAEQHFTDHCRLLPDGD